MKALSAYGTNYLIDTKEAVIIDVEATPARWSAEVTATKTMLTRVEDRIGIPHLVRGMKPGAPQKRRKPVIYLNCRHLNVSLSKNHRAGGRHKPAPAHQPNSSH
jgi:hypothetical protein